EIDPADERSAYLDVACGNQHGLRQRVEALLRRHAQGKGPLDRPGFNLVPTTDRPIAERPGTVIGPYKLLEQIGEGGFRIVFIPVCQAIQHAHQKGIIHRDIKPSNVMVCLYDGKPVPKVIDFGVAKAIEQRLTERTLFTQYGTIVGTFEYMAPEQAELSQLGV